MTKKVIVLGASGMLGSMVSGYLVNNPELSVLGTTREQFDAEQFAHGRPQKIALEADTIINCIGVIKPFCKDTDPAGVQRAIIINGLFPHRLATAAKANGVKVIQIATDCVYSGQKGNYAEDAPHDALDVYGKTKSLGEVFDKSLLNIRCSIIGPEIKNKVSLLEWFLGNAPGSELKGFTHHNWNGVTTLQFAKLCEKIIMKEGVYESLLERSSLHHFLPNSTVNKYELLQLMQEVFETEFIIKPVGDVGPAVDRTIGTKYQLLGSLYPAGQMRDALGELRDYMDDQDQTETKSNLSAKAS